MNPQPVCSICCHELDEDSMTVVREKGLQTLIKKSQEKKDGKWQQWSGKREYPFHVHCRKRYAVSSSKSTSQLSSESHTSLSASIESAPPSETDKSLVSPSPLISECSLPSSQFSTSFAEHESTFDFEQQCFICGKKCDRRKPESLIRDNYHKHRFITIAGEHEYDFGAPIIARLQNIESLVASKARYHKVCYKKFMSPIYKKTPSPPTNETPVIFEKICEYIETSSELKFKLSTLKELMGDDEENQIETRTLLRRLKKKYGDDIFIFQHAGRESFIYYKFYDIAKICSEWFNGSEGLSESAKSTIVNVAAEIIKEEVMKKKFDTKIYPTPQEFRQTVTSDIPSLLNTFLHKLLIFDRKEQPDGSSFFVKIENIAHTILSALRPRSFMSCLQLSVGTYIHQKTKSRLVINLLNKLGVCSSYHSIQLHEASTSINSQPTVINDSLIQYVFDNTDHNADDN